MITGGGRSGMREGDVFRVHWAMLCSFGSRRPCIIRFDLGILSLFICAVGPETILLDAGTVTVIPLPVLPQTVRHELRAAQRLSGRSKITTKRLSTNNMPMKHHVHTTRKCDGILVGSNLEYPDDFLPTIWAVS